MTTYSTHATSPELASTVNLVVAWCRLRPSITALVGTRVSTSKPKREEDTTYPWLQVQRVVGVAALPEAAIDRARIQFNAWGGVKANESPNWEPADALIRAVEHQVRTLFQARVDGKGVIMSTSLLEGIQQLQDPDTGGARFWMDAVFVTRKE